MIKVSQLFRKSAKIEKLQTGVQTTQKLGCTLDRFLTGVNVNGSVALTRFLLGAPIKAPLTQNR